jgi:hypothetical protein
MSACGSCTGAGSLMLFVGMNNVTYSVKCPNCSKEAAAQMRPTGERGGFREPTLELGAGRILCRSCGFAREVPPQESGGYELWYATTFRGHRLWACNRKHLSFLIAWFSGDLRKADLGIGDRDIVESFPRWMISAKNRPGVLRSLHRLAGINANNTVQQTGASRSGRSRNRMPLAAGSRR